MNIIHISKVVITLFIAALSLAGCATATGPMGTLPNIENSDIAGEVTVIRNKNFVGAGNSYKVTLDGQDIFGLKVGKYTKFLVNEGEHYIGVKCFGGWTPTWKEDSLEFNVSSKIKSYFLISPNLKCADIKSINEEEAQERMSKSKFVDMGQ